MSPAAQELFMSQIAPILMAAVPRVVIAVGAEDADELVQDALVAACEAVHRLEKRGKQIIPRSVAYYTIQRLKTGRRSTGAGRTDVMSPGCQFDGNASISSLDEPVHVSDDITPPAARPECCRRRRAGLPARATGIVVPHGRAEPPCVTVCLSRCAGWRVAASRGTRTVAGRRRWAGSLCSRRCERTNRRWPCPATPASRQPGRGP